MKPNRKAKNYSRILLDLAKSSNAVREVGEALLLVSHFLKVDSSFRAFFHTRKINPVDKAQILVSIFKSQCHPITAEFFGIIAAKKKWRLFHPTALVYQIMQQEELNIIPVTAVTSLSLPDDDRIYIKAVVEKATGKIADFRSQVDKKLIGGLRLRIGNLFFDGTVLQRLEQLRTELLNA